jgi:hypothetical protein
MQGEIRHLLLWGVILWKAVCLLYLKILRVLTFINESPHTTNWLGNWLGAKSSPKAAVRDTQLSCYLMLAYHFPFPCRLSSDFLDGMAMYLNTVWIRLLRIASPFLRCCHVGSLKTLSCI